MILERSSPVSGSYLYMHSLKWLVYMYVHASICIFQYMDVALNCDSRAQHSLEYFVYVYAYASTCICQFVDVALNCDSRAQHSLD